MVYNASICLSHLIQDDGILSEQSRRRVEKSYDELMKKEVERIVVSGGHKNKKTPISSAKAMQIYLLRKGVDSSLVLLEESSLDTVSQAIFTKVQIVVPNNWGRLSVVADNDHMFRVRTIFDFVYGPDFDIRYSGTGFNLIEGDLSTHQRERKLLDDFYRTFEGVRTGDDSQLLERLYSSHPYFIKASEGI